jgi:DNA-binding beta-propeller fold protein YncE
LSTSYIQHTLSSDDARGFYFTANGSKLFTVADFSPYTIKRYDLSTPWDISTATYINNFSTSDFYGDDVFLSEDGTKVYATDHKYDKIFEYTLSTPWDLTTATQNTSFSTSATRGIFMRKQGTKLYLPYNAYVYQYKLSTPWSLATLSSEINFNDGFAASYDIFISPDGKNAYIIDHNTHNIKQYKLGM